MLAILSEVNAIFRLTMSEKGLYSQRISIQCFSMGLMNGKCSILDTSLLFILLT